jgi:UDPglucose 6-dehydrogenase
VGILGLTFKANTDDIRFAPSIDLIRRLLAEGASLRAYDPEAMEKTRAIFPQVQYIDPYEVASGADALLIVTEWEEFKKLDWMRIRNSMLRPLVLDGRNLLDPAKMKELGFEYQSIGRPA